ncbi:MAG: terminase family protein [Planctomycetota bacterium]
MQRDTSDNGDPDAVLRAIRPRTATALRRLLRAIYRIDLPVEPILDGSTTPMEYLAHSFLELDEPRDCVVWAARGAGKTFYAAVATALDLVFKPGVEVRILGGSLEQAARMHEHLRRLFERPALGPLLDGSPTDRRITLHNGSTASIGAATHASVRGTRPQILRCDEADLIDRDIWQAAQLTTRSKLCGGVFVRGRVEALSTWHRPAALMADLVADASAPGDGTLPRARRLFRWSVIDVLERCPPERPCEPCPLHAECRGRAKDARGHITIDDAITLKRRADAHAWHAEMLCERPRRTTAVFPEFDPDVHVFDAETAAPTGSGVGRGLTAPSSVAIIAGMDFGYRSPTVILVATLDPEGVVRVVSERLATRATIGAHADWVLAHDPAPAWIGVDPAGHQHSEQTGTTNISLLRQRGLRVRARRAPIDLGLRAIRARLRPATGSPTLFISSACRTLIGAMRAYRYPDNTHELTPVKDGHDHPADALRYLILNLDHPHRESSHMYW